MAHAVNWFQIQGPDGHILHTFYKNVFHWEMSPLEGNGDAMMVPPQAPDGIAGGIGTSMNKKPSVAVYVSVNDIDAYLGKVERAGGHLAMPKMELPNDMGFVGGFTDPAGNWVGLWEPSETPSQPTRQAASGAKKQNGAKMKSAGATKTSASAKPAKTRAKASGKTAAKKTAKAAPPKRANARATTAKKPGRKTGKRRSS